MRRHRQIVVPELLLYEQHRHAFAVHFRGARVAQAVGVHALLDPSLAGVELEHLAQAARPQRPAGAASVMRDRAEQRRAWGDPYPLALGQPLAQVAAGRPVDTHDAPLRALAVQHRHGADLEVDVLHAQRQGLGRTEPHAPEQHDQRPGANPRPSLRERLEQRRDLSWGQDLGRVALALVGRRPPSPVLRERHERPRPPTGGQEGIARRGRRGQARPGKPLGCRAAFDASAAMSGSAGEFGKETGVPAGATGGD